MSPAYTAISITPAGRDAVRRMAATVTGQLGQRVSMSDALRIAERIVADHLDAVADLAGQLGITPEGDPQ